MATSTISSAATIGAPAGRSLFVRRSAAILLVSDGLMHTAVLHEHFQKVVWLGALFVCAIVMFVYTGFALWSRNGPLDWWGALFVAGGTFAGYVISRTVGFPGFHSAWDALGISTLVIELLIVMGFMVRSPAHEVLTALVRT